MTTPYEAILDEAIAAAAAERGAPASTKTSSAGQESPPPTSREKLSSIVQRNEDLMRLGTFVHQLGLVGFEKAAMDSTGAEEVTSDPTGLPDPVATHAVSAAIQSGNTVVPPARSAGGAAQPMTHITSRGGDNPDNISGSSPGQVGPPPDAQGRMPTQMSGEGGASADKGAEGNIPEMTLATAPTAAKMSASRAHALMQKVSGGMYLRDGDPATVLRRYGIDSAAGVVGFLKRSADSRKMTLADFLDGAELHDMRKTELLVARAKASSDEDQYRLDMAKARDAVDAAIQTTGALPTGSDIVRVTNVDPAVAAAAQMQVAQTIVAAGGSLAAPGGVEASGISGAGAAGAAAAAGVPPLAPPSVQPPAFAPAPIDPSMAGMNDPNAAMAGPPPVPPGPMPPEAMPPKMAMDARAALRQVLSRWDKKSMGPLADREEPSTGAPSPREQAIRPTDGPTPSAEGSAVFEMSASERAVADALSSNQSTIDTTEDDAEASKRGEIDGRVTTAVTGPSTKGTMTSDAPVKGTKEGEMSVPEGANVSDKMSGDFVARIRAAAEGALKESSVMMATGRGSQHIVGATPGVTGGPSDQMTSQVKKAYAFARQHIEERGDTPDVRQVMQTTGANLDDAKKGIHHAARG